MPTLYESENDNLRPPDDDGAPRPATEPVGSKPSSQTDKIDAGSGESGPDQDLPPLDPDESRQPS